ncbi:hypothetical protein QAD02_006536 [Eretmocerus hayati]|uniref:Uncharacterized protein n=1 Tax=Eretmocerus hayati TaxID=131215 RepID=A0ACC2N1G1_9HYME|nr:hypothetical protein QAD02_006536 [Eretmocerus hayati]
MNKIWLLLLFCSIATDANEVKREIDARLAMKAETCNPGEVPYHASIQLGGSHVCGGAIISQTHILTAGHCVDDYIKNPVILLTQRLVIEVGSVVAGSGTIHQIRRISRKEGFDPNPRGPYFMPNDIAVITLRTPVQISKDVRPVELPEPNFRVPDGSRVLVSGYGGSEVNTPVSKILKKAELYVLSHNDCNEFYSEKFRKTVLSSHICTMRGPGHGTCQGDSGGPLAWNNKIIGVVSGGTGHCNAGHPDVYTRVASHMDYVNYEMNYDFQKRYQDSNLAKAIDMDSLGMGIFQQQQNLLKSQLNFQSIPQFQQQIQQQQTVPQPFPSIFYPAGQQFYPTGQVSYPQGQVPYPQRQVPYPQGQVSYPQGQVSYPQGQLSYPQGQGIYLQGQKAYPSNGNFLNYYYPENYKSKDKKEDPKSAGTTTKAPTSEAVSKDPASGATTKNPAKSEK